MDQPEIELTDEELDDLFTAISTTFRSDVDAQQLLRRIGFPRQRVPTFTGRSREAWNTVFFDFGQGIIDAPYLRLLTAALPVYPRNATLVRLANTHGSASSATQPPPTHEPSPTDRYDLPRAVPAAPPPPTDGADSRGGVFLCHSSGDKEQVRELHRHLTGDGIACWLDEEDLLPGQDWDREIRRVLRRSRHVVVCLSAASITKVGYLQRELRLALDRADEQPEGSIFLVPVRLEECTVPDRLRHLHYVDLFAANGYDRLRKALRAG